MTSSWRVETVAGAALQLLEPPDLGARTARFLVPDHDVVVIGSSQPASDIDAERAAAASLAVLRRASGGGAVLVGPDHLLWVDVTVPTGDPLSVADVRRAFWWLGDLWAAALAAVGVPGGLVWRGGLVKSAWSGQVCFAGLGPGEVTVDEAKVVGISQRRTRAGAHFQCAALIDWDPIPLLDVLSLDPAARSRGPADLAGVARGVGAAVGPALQRAFVDRLPG